MRFSRMAGLLPALALGLGACAPAVPESGAARGVGFGDYQSYVREREQALATGAPTSAPPAALGGALPLAATAPVPGGNPGLAPMPGALAAAPAAPAPAASDPSAPLPASILAAVPGAAVPGAAGAAPSAPPAASAPVSASPMPSAPVAAVPLAAAPVAPAPVAPAPVVAGSGGVNLAAYALGASNAYGVKTFPRSKSVEASQKACAKFTSSDLAQRAFLGAGGPQKDPRNLDADGDGFACGWDPRPFQAARP